VFKNKQGENYENLYRINGNAGSSGRVLNYSGPRILDSGLSC
jgi:hypothetical protein